MLIPIRCFSCGKPIAHLWEKYQEMKENGMEPKDIFSKLGIERFCCRATFLGHVDLIDETSQFKKF